MVLIIIIITVLLEGFCRLKWAAQAESYPLVIVLVLLPIILQNCRRRPQLRNFVFMEDGEL